MTLLTEAMLLHMRMRGKWMLEACEASRSTWLQEHGLSGGGDVKRVTQVVGTDCAGTDAPIMALQRLGLQFHHLFACDIAPWLAQLHPMAGVKLR